MDKDLDEQDRKELAKGIAEVMTMFMKDGLTDMNQMDICHTCGKMRLYCNCVDCNCTNCKTDNKNSDGKT